MANDEQVELWEVALGSSHNRRITRHVSRDGQRSVLEQCRILRDLLDRHYELRETLLTAGDDDGDYPGRCERQLEIRRRIDEAIAGLEMTRACNVAERSAMGRIWGAYAMYLEERPPDAALEVVRVRL